MSELYTINFDAESQLFHVSGELTLETAVAVVTETEGLFEKVAAIEVDLGGVSRSDSAGLALMINWMRLAHQADKRIRFHNLPAQMLAIAKASGLDEVLPLQ